MTTVAVSLPETLADYVEERVRSGKSSDSSQVIQKALRVLQAVESRRSAFDAAVDEGLRAIDRGEVEAVDDLELWFVELRKSWRD